MQKIKKAISLVVCSLMVACCLFTVACKDDSAVSKDKVFDMLKSALATQTAESYTDGFTINSLEIYKGVTKLNEKKTILGTTDVDGEPWASEEAKTEFLETIKGSQCGEYTSKYSTKASYDIANGKGYNIKRTYNAETDKMELDDIELFQKEQDGNYYYYDLDRNYKYLVAQDYYMQDYDNNVGDIITTFKGFAGEDVTLDEFIEQMKESLKSEESIDEVYDVTISVKTSAKKNKDVYSLTIELTVKQTLKNGEVSNLGMDNIQVKYSMSFSLKNSKVVKVKTESAQSYERYVYINDSENSGVTVFDGSMSACSELEIKEEYDTADCPTLDESVTYDYKGAMPVYLDLYIDGKEVYNVYYNDACCGGEVASLYTFLDYMMSSDAVWYRDEDCTVPLLKTEKWTACSSTVELYTKSEYIKEGFVIVGELMVTEDEYSPELIGDENFNYALYSTDKYNYSNGFEYAIVNGTRVEKGGEITLVEGRINTVVFVMPVNDY